MFLQASLASSRSHFAVLDTKKRTAKLSVIK